MNYRTVTPTKIIRLGNTPNGNSRWRIETNAEVFYTKPDTGDAAKITGNETGRDVRLTFDEKWRVIGWDPVP